MKAKDSKWQRTDRDSTDTSGRVTYTPSYAKVPAKFSPKKAVRSFRDLEVYQRPMECSILIVAELIPILTKDKFPLVEGMRDCALSIPLRVAEAHGQRFSDFAKATATLETAMQGCNKMIVYLEQASGLAYNVDSVFLEDMMKRYLDARGKMLRLLRSWQKFRQM